MNRFRAFFQSRSMTWGRVEMLIMRLLFAAVILWSGIVWKLPLDPDTFDKPNGVAAVLPLGWMAKVAASGFTEAVTGITLALYAFGIAPALTLLPALLLMTGTGALRNSMGDISHHTQLVAMVLLAQWIVYLVAAIRRRAWLRVAHQEQERVILWSLITIGAGYLASGMVKLKASDFEWIQRVPSISVQVMKAVWSASYSSGEAVSGFKAVTIPHWIAEHPNLARLFFGTGLILELLGICLVLSRRHAFWLGLALIGMHTGITLIMDIEFWNHILLVAIFAVNVPGFILARKQNAAR